MSERVKQLEQDIAEYQRLLLETQRPNVQNHLAQHVSKLKTELENLRFVKVVQQPIKQSPPPKQNNSQQIDRTNFVPLTKYAWDQQGSKVKLIFSLEGVGVQCTKQQVQVIFTNWSVEMRIKGYKKLNHIFAIKKLSGQIVPAECKYVLKNNGITITLVKKENKSWPQIQFKEEKFGSKNEKEQEKDPGANIMGMMKKMYEEGDQNMKRTIAEAWTKANDKKGQQPDFSDRYDFLKK